MPRLRLAMLLAALSLIPSAAYAEQKPKPAKSKAISITSQDIRQCTGVDRAKPGARVAVCTKLIDSGKIKPVYLADFYAARGRAYFARREYDKAKADFNVAIAKRETPQFYHQRGLLYAAMHEWDAAKADLEKAIALKPAFVLAHFSRGVVSYQMGDYAEALAYFEDAVKRAPSFYQGIFARGAAKKKLGDEKGGEADIVKARAMSSKVDGDLARLGIRA